MHGPDHGRRAGKARGQPTHKIGVIEPRLNDVRPVLGDYPLQSPQSCDAEPPAAHAQRGYRYTPIPQRLTINTVLMK